MTQLEQDLSAFVGAPTRWIDVCADALLVPDRGACALVDSEPVAIFRCSPGDELYAVGNIDPYSGASVLSRGIVGSIDGRPVVASPIFKQRFDLRTGESLADPSVSVPTYDVRATDDRIWVLTRPLTSAAITSRPA